MGKLGRMGRLGRMGNYRLPSLPSTTQHYPAYPAQKKHFLSEVLSRSEADSKVEPKARPRANTLLAKAEGQASIYSIRATATKR